MIIPQNKWMKLFFLRDFHVIKQLYPHYKNNGDSVGSKIVALSLVPKAQVSVQAVEENDVTVD